MTAIEPARVDVVRSGDLLRWSLAGALALAAHVGAVAGYLLLHEPEPQAPAGAPVVLVDLAAVPSAPEVQSLDLPEEKPAEKSEPVPEETKPPEEPPPKLPQLSEPVAPVVTAPPKPEVKPKKPPAPRTVAQARAPNRTDVASTPQLGAAAAETRAAQASWNSLVSQHLQRHKRYPDSAQARREQGVVVVGFTVNRSGHVLSRRIVRSSGFAELDQEAMALLLRAQPLPAFPPAMTQVQVDRTAPLQFSLH